ncbi:PREDICTED: replication protein A 70 kDa DNA-binding subunit B-like [Camelina sativa]|uniref:Replication protein A 70 kDa DNA-binding subunit B-like n=1 Tax=Camelina sativa TaxID=90675 RepID=A0ABM0TTM3_CAMSA|nr:PREDICTED: replication protein A 70 kDa DNA-binding subunit B-like [Camelina sativa]
MAASFALLRELRPYKSSWRIQVKVLHSWHQYTVQTGETLEMVLADTQGVKIHASVKKDLVPRFAPHVRVGEWKFVETFGLTHSTGQFRPTNHLYKIGFQTGTVVSRCENISDSNYLSLAKFEPILNEEINPYAMGQVVNIGELELKETNNKPNHKLDFELRDEKDVRLPCTLWGSHAEQVFTACQEANGAMVICVIRFAKVKNYKGVVSLSNSYNTTQVFINPPILNLPNDGLTLTFRENAPQNQIVALTADQSDQFPRRTISELLNSQEIGKARVLCTIYAIDTDWSWYYFSCRNCNKKVTHIYPSGKEKVIKETKQKFWCDVCKSIVTNVDPRTAAKIITQSAATLLNGSLAEIADPENLPDPINNVIGKTYLFLVCVEKANILDGKDSYKVAKVLLNDGTLGEESMLESQETINSDSIVSGEQMQLMLTNSEDGTETNTPSSKRQASFNVEPAEQSSTTKKLCLAVSDLDKQDENMESEGIADCGGTKDCAIQASVLPNRVPKFQDQLVKGQLYNINDFDVVASSNRYCRTNHKWFSTFSDLLDMVDKGEELPGNNLFCIVRISGLLASTLFFSI